MSKGSKMYSPDTMSNPFCNHTALQCVLVHQWLSCGEYQLVSEVKFVLKPVPIISCRKRAAWYKLAPLHESFEPARALSQIPVWCFVAKQSKLMVKVDCLIFADLEMTEDVKEWFAMEPSRVAKVFINRHISFFTLKIVKNYIIASFLGGRQIDS